MTAPEASLPPTEPIDMIPLLRADSPETDTRPHSRHVEAEWHRRGLLAPAELDALVTARVNDLPAIAAVTPVTSDDLITSDEPTYGDFLREPTA
ncbi:hypothetical protein [Curtobacterium sp. VKM Ac-1376]|uniref:hypothetical protein n=1 Tax=Curtobacterium sp. VKM Ac-1376 TaxID=123312 RepID=UPI00188BC289|nr:hypothetical protein [Curtobacterium sp. VKM Ac-1376]MBF4616447.1 hypothetical protein [Curtobacterium sp. VKM Ac-1376]